VKLRSLQSHFKDVIRKKRRNEYLRLKHTERYRKDPEPWETIYKDVRDTAVSGLTENTESFDRREATQAAFGLIARAEV